MAYLGVQLTYKVQKPSPKKSLSLTNPNIKSKSIKSSMVVKSL